MTPKPVGSAEDGSLICMYPGHKDHWKKKNVSTHLLSARAELSNGDTVRKNTRAQRADLGQAQLLLKKNIWRSARKKKEASWTASPFLSPFSLSVASQRSDLLKISYLEASV